MTDYLDGTVDEVKDKIREAEDVDYEELLEKEENGKNRKTVVEFLEMKIGEEVEEELQKSDEEKVEDELVEEIEEETEEGILGGFNRQQILAGGTMLGLVFGLIIGGLALSGGQNAGITQAQATDRVTQLLTASGQISEENLTVETTERNGMYYINATATTIQNGTERTQSQTYYMSSNGALMFPEVIRSPFGTQRVAIDVNQAIQRAQQQQNQPQTGNQTQ